MITVGSVSREQAARKFYFLQEQIEGRRKAVNELTHTNPDFVFWIYPDGRLFDAKDAHIRNYPKGYRWILDDEPDYGGFLRGRVATNMSGQVIVVYCRPEALAFDPGKIGQFLDGISQLPVPLADDALVISDNGDIYGTIADLESRLARLNQGATPETDPPPTGGPSAQLGNSGATGGPSSET
jgi:hypothetical protein